MTTELKDSEDLEKEKESIRNKINEMEPRRNKRKKKEITLTTEPEEPKDLKKKKERVNK